MMRLFAGRFCHRSFVPFVTVSRVMRFSGGAMFCAMTCRFMSFSSFVSAMCSTIMMFRSGMTVSFAMAFGLYKIDGSDNKTNKDQDRP